MPHRHCLIRPSPRSGCPRPHGLPELRMATPSLLPCCLLFLHLRAKPAAQSVQDVPVCCGGLPAGFGDPDPVARSVVSRRAADWRVFGYIVLPGTSAVTGGRFAGGPDDPPPGHSASTAGQHSPNLAGAAGTKNLGNVSIGKYCARRYKLHYRQHGFLIVLPHTPSLTAPGALNRELSVPAGTFDYMLSWHELPRASFDLETTGRDPLQARIVTASIILVDAEGGILKHHEWLVDPGVDIPEEAAAIHGISTERARADGIPARLGVEEIIQVLQDTFAAGIPVLAFNAAYDFTVLAREAERCGLSAPVPFPVIDPFIMDKQADRYRRGKRTLTAMAEHYGVAFENAHTSAADVMATLAVGAAMASAFPLLAQDAASLHQLQTGWAAEQAASFQSYLRRRDPEAVIDGAWPVKQAPVNTSVPATTPAPAEVRLAEEPDGQLVLDLSEDTLTPA